MIFKIIFILLLIIIFLIAFYCAISIYWHKRFEKKCDQSKYQVSSLGYNIAVSGPKGSGKSTTCAAFAHIITMFYIWKIRTTLNSIRKKLYFLNFNFIEQSFIYFLNELSLLESPPSKTWYYDVAIEKTVNLVLSAYENSLNEFYINFVDIEIKRNLLEDYLLNYLVLNFRRKFVVSTSGFFNRVSLEHGLFYDPNSIELRKVLEKKNFDQDFFNIIFNDEATISRSNALSNDKSIKLSGSLIFKILERNAYLGTHYTITMKQDAMNEVKNDRSLQDCNLEIFDRVDDIGTFKKLRSLLDSFFNLCCIPVKVWFFIKALFVRDVTSYELFERHMKKYNLLRRIEYKIFKLQELLLSFGFIRVRLKMYKRPEDVGKEDEKKYVPYVFYFKRIYAYGVINTNEYRPLIEELQRNYSSNNNIKVVSTFRSSDRVDHYKKIIEMGGITDDF